MRAQVPALFLRDKEKSPGRVARARGFIPLLTGLCADQTIGVGETEVALGAVAHIT